MMYLDLLNKLIDDGIAAATSDYEDEKHGAAMRAGAVEGFNACRGLQPEQLAELMATAGRQLEEAYIRVNEKEISDEEYWKASCRHAEIYWMANCVSAVLMNEGRAPIVTPTARAVLAIAKIMGVGGAP